MSIRSHVFHFGRKIGQLFMPVTSRCYQGVVASQITDDKTYVVDLRSDTLTKPTKPMLDAMVDSTFGDDVFNEEPTVHSKLMQGMTGNRL